MMEAIKKNNQVRFGITERGDVAFDDGWIPAVKNGDVSAAILISKGIPTPTGKLGLDHSCPRRTISYSLAPLYHLGKGDFPRDMDEVTRYDNANYLVRYCASPGEI